MVVHLSMKRSIVLLLLSLLPIFVSVLAQKENIGTCIIKGNSVLGINYTDTYPMYSVMKFPQALYIANKLANSGAGLNEIVTVKRADLMQNTWSPMLKEMADEGSFSYGELLALSLQQSDNNACDILFREFGGPKRVERFLRRIGFKQIHVRKTEQQMHATPSASSLNWTTPKEMACLLLWFYQHHNDNVYMQYIWNLLAECRTGEDRIPAALPEGASVVHKTGTGYPTQFGPSGIADVGIVMMPDGKDFPIAVFVESPVNSSRIAEIARDLMAIPD